MKVIKLFVLIIIFSLLFAGCMPDDEVISTGPLYFGEAADYIYFEEGSWWVYVNDVTSEKDSTIVTASEKEMRYYGCVENENSIQKEDMTMSTKSLTICRNQNIDINQPLDCLPLNNLNSYFQFGVIDGCQSGSRSVMFYFPFDLHKGGGASQDVIFKGKLDSLQVQDKWYYDVVEFEVDIDYSWNQRRTKYFWAKNVGLIKREQYMNFTDEFLQSWELIDYKVTQ